MLHRIRSVLEMIKFSHTIFALPFALMSATLAWQEKRFAWWDLAGLLLCLVFARSAAMAFNRLADREFDARNPRTAGRHIPAGQLSSSFVRLFVVVTSLGFVASTCIFLLGHNPWPVYLSLPVLLFLLAYSYTKRFTVLAHFWLGAALLLAPLAAWIAIRGMHDLSQPVFLGAAVLFWVAGFDIIYACQDAEFDRRAGLFSIPAKLGVRNALWVAAICHAVMVACLVGLWTISPHLFSLYLWGVVAVAGLLLYEHSLVRPDDLSRANQAFYYVNGVISGGLLVVVWIQLALGA